MNIILFVLLFILHAGQSQIGTDCETDADCNALQHCLFGYCNCEFGYVKNIGLKHCFEIKKHGEECFFDIQCNDHRMVCNYGHEEDEVRRCICDRFHEWSDELRECYPNINITEFLANLGDGNDMGKQIEREAEKVFLGLVVVGLTIVSILLSFIGICSIYGCCCTDKMGGEDELLDTKNIDQVAVVGLPDQMAPDMSMDFAF